MSSLYRIHPEEKILQGVREVDFADFHFKERFDIQEWINSTPEILGEKLLIISKENSCFEGTNERPDLIALDKDGNIVVIELKRDDSGKGLEWQAIKYASYWSRFKVSDIVNNYREYLRKELKNKEDGGDITIDSVKEKIVEFIDDDDLDGLNKRQRLILVSHRFAKEVTSAVHWLIESSEIDIKCVQLIPYYDSDKESHYLLANTILPVPGVDDLLIKAMDMSTPEKRRSVGPVRKDDDITAFFEKVRDKVLDELSIEIRPNKNSRWAGVDVGYRYYHFWYQEDYWSNWGLSYKMWLWDRDDEDYPDHFHIFLDLGTKSLLTQGVTEKSLKNIHSFLKELKIPDFEFEEDDTSMWVGTFIENNSLSEEKLNEVVSVVKELIKSTKSEMTRLLACGFV